MNSLMPYRMPEHELLPPRLRRELARSEARMDYIAQVARRAAEEVSYTHSFAVFMVATTVMATSKIRRFFWGEAVPPDVERTLQQMDQHYLWAMEQIPYATARQVLEELNRLPPHRDDGNLLEDLRAAFGRSLTG